MGIGVLTIIKVLEGAIITRALEYLEKLPLPLKKGRTINSIYTKVLFIKSIDRVSYIRVRAI